MQLAVSRTLGECAAAGLSLKQCVCRAASAPHFRGYLTATNRRRRFSSCGLHRQTGVCSFPRTMAASSASRNSCACTATLLHLCGARYCADTLSVCRLLTLASSLRSPALRCIAPLPSSLHELARRIGPEQLPSLHLPLCKCCGTQTSDADPSIAFDAADAPYKCRICLDPRQYVPVTGQKWTTLPRLAGDPTQKYHNEVEELVPGQVWQFRTLPNVGIGQRAFLIKDAKAGGELVMWDCVAYVDDATLKDIDRISDGKGIRHIVISHPHFYTTSAVWTAAFPRATLWLAEPDFTDWYQRKDILQSANEHARAVRKRIRQVTDTRTLLDGEAFSNFSIYKLGGHFPGSTVLLWNDILFVADTLAVIPSGLYKSDALKPPDTCSISFLWR